MEKQDGKYGLFSDNRDLILPAAYTGPHAIDVLHFPRGILFPVLRIKREEKKSLFRKHLKSIISKEYYFDVWYQAIKNALMDVESTFFIGTYNSTTDSYEILYEITDSFDKFEHSKTSKKKSIEHNPPAVFLKIVAKL